MQHPAQRAQRQQQHQQQSSSAASDVGAAMAGMSFALRQTEERLTCKVQAVDDGVQERLQAVQQEMRSQSAAVLQQVAQQQRQLVTIIQQQQRLMQQQQLDVSLLKQQQREQQQDLLNHIEQLQRQVSSLQHQTGGTVVAREQQEDATQTTNDASYDMIGYSEDAPGFTAEERPAGDEKTDCSEDPGFATEPSDFPDPSFGGGEEEGPSSAGGSSAAPARNIAAADATGRGAASVEFWDQTASREPTEKSEASSSSRIPDYLPQPKEEPPPTLTDPHAAELQDETPSEDSTILRSTADDDSVATESDDDPSVEAVREHAFGRKGVELLSKFRANQAATVAAVEKTSVVLSKFRMNKAEVGEESDLSDEDLDAVEKEEFGQRKSELRSKFRSNEKEVGRESVEVPFESESPAEEESAHFIEDETTENSIDEDPSSNVDTSHRTTESELSGRLYGHDPVEVPLD
jgi:hypothetical protein